MTPEIKGFLLLTVIKLVTIFTITLVSVAYITLLERKLCAYMQFRYGPNRVGPRGWFQPLADGLKNILKEETFPAGANPVLFLLAPALALIPATMMSLVLPWAAPVPMNFDFTVPLLGRFVNTGLMPIAVADLPVGFLFVIAVSSMGVFGIALAGWSSNNKYSLLGGLRASAQMISYEVAMGLSLIPVLLLTGNVSFSQIITQQQAGLWFVLPLFLSSFIFTVSSFAETNRVPFDLPESESELVAGYHTEYSAMKFSLFFIAEYANMITASAMISILFLGGYDIPFTHWDETPGLWQTLATGAVMFLKTTLWIFVFIWVRWTLPRFRYDQLMALGWKVLMPIGLAYIMYLGLGIYLAESVLGLTGATAKMWLLFGMNLPVIYLVFLVLDRGHLISGSTERGRTPAGRLERAV